MSSESVLDIIEGYLDREGQVYERNVYGNVDGIHIEFDIGCKLGTITESFMVYDDTLPVPGIITVGALGLLIPRAISDLASETA